VLAGQRNLSLLQGELQEAASRAEGYQEQLAAATAAAAAAEGGAASVAAAAAEAARAEAAAALEAQGDKVARLLAEVEGRDAALQHQRAELELALSQVGGGAELLRGA
jgi:hypothetical protein